MSATAEPRLEAMTLDEAGELAAMYANAGIPVFPIGLSWNGESVDKKPLTKHGFKDAATDLQVVDRMFRKAHLNKGQSIGVGIHPGPAGFVILDVDIKGGGTGVEDLKRLSDELGELPGETTRIDTASGGWHFWFKRPPGVDLIGNANLAPGVEVRCDSGYVVAPGVKTEWGEWKRDPTTARVTATPPLPPRWAGKLNGLNADGTRPPIAEEITQGSRHAALRRVAGAMRRQGANGDEIHAALTVMNTNRCKPPKPDKDIKNLAEDIATRYTPEPDITVTLSTGETLNDGVSKELTRMRDRAKAKQIFDTENRPEVEQAEILTLRQLVARPLPDTTYRIDQYQPADSRVMLAAQAKAGKTTLTGNVTRSLVDGDLFLGVHPVNPVDRVGIVDFEMSERQLAAWLKDQAIKNDDRVTVIPMRGKASTFDLLDERTLDEWAQRLTGIDYLILDCLRPVLDALGLKESSEAGRFLTPFDELCDKAGIRDTLIVHHMGHYDERSRGDSRIRDWPDVEWQLVREDKDDPASRRYLKAYGRDVEVAESLLLYDAGSRHYTLTGGTRKETKARAAIPDIIDLLQTAENGLSIRQITKEMSVPGHSRDVVRQALRLSEGDGTLDPSKGPRNARVYTLSVPVSGSVPTDPPYGESERASASIGTGALHTHSEEEVSAPEQPELTEPA